MPGLGRVGCVVRMQYADVSVVIPGIDGLIPQRSQQRRVVQPVPHPAIPQRRHRLPRRLQHLVVVARGHTALVHGEVRLEDGDEDEGGEEGEDEDVVERPAEALEDGAGLAGAEKEDGADEEEEAEGEGGEDEGVVVLYALECHGGNAMDSEWRYTQLTSD